MQVTIAQVITFLNICELAYSLAFRQLLYKPLSEGDQERVREIYHGAVRIFRVTGMAVLGLALIGACLFPMFRESPLPYWQTSGMFLLLAVPYGISYFLMGPNFVIMADQKEYKINIWIQSISILRMSLMVLAIRLKQPFVWMLLIEAANILGANYIARRIALKAYPWLKEIPGNRTDRSFGKKARYAVIQRLSELATTQTDNIVISAFMGYEMTSVFGTYSYLTDSIAKITQSMVTSPMNSFGNLFNDKRADAYRIFTEFFNFSTYISTIVSVVIFIVMPQFVHIWMRQPLYEVSSVICLAFALNIFYMTMRQPVLIARDANGLYVNAKNNAYLMAVSKIVLSIIFVQKFRLLGVILATTITNWTVDFFYNPGLVYKHVFGLPVRRYYFMVFSRVLIGAGIGLCGYFAWEHYLPFITVSIGRFVLAALILGMATTFVTTVVYAVSYRSFRHLFVRLKSIFMKKRGLSA